MSQDIQKILWDSPKKISTIQYLKRLNLNDIEVISLRTLYFKLAIVFFFIHHIFYKLLVDGEIGVSISKSQDIEIEIRIYR